MHLPRPLQGEMSLAFDETERLIHWTNPLTPHEGLTRHQDSVFQLASRPALLT